MATAALAATATLVRPADSEGASERRLTGAPSIAAALGDFAALGPGFAPAGGVVREVARRPVAARYDNALIADIALTYVGEWGGNACRNAHRSGLTGSTRTFPVEPRRAADGKVTKEGDGQCRSFVNCVVWMASGRRQWIASGGRDYFAGFLHPSGGGSGATEIKRAARLVKGDVVQVGNGTHTYVVVARVRDNLFTVVDSNRDLKENVTTYNRRLTLGAKVRAFRLGTVVAAQPPADIHAPDAHDRAIVQELLAYQAQEQAWLDSIEADLEAKLTALFTAAEACPGLGVFDEVALTFIVAVVNLPRWYPEYFSRGSDRFRSWHPHQPVLAEWLRLGAHGADAFFLIGGTPLGPADMCRIAAGLIRYSQENPDPPVEEALVVYLKLTGVSDYKARSFVAELTALGEAAEALEPQVRVFLFASGLTPAQVAELLND